MALTATSVAKSIEFEVGKLSAAQPGVRALVQAVPGGPAATFCDIWPKAKPILEALASMAAVIPGMGTVAAAVLRGLIAMGDAAASEVCGA